MPSELWVVELKKPVVTPEYSWHAGKPLRCFEAHANWLIKEHGAKLISKPKERAVKASSSAEVATPVTTTIPPDVKEAAKEQMQFVAATTTDAETEDKK